MNQGCVFSGKAYDEWIAWINHAQKVGRVQMGLAFMLAIC
jgi:hypothetical protein